MPETQQSEKQQLEEKRARLRARLEAIEQDYRSGLDADSEEQAQQLENAEVLAGIARAAAEELERIEKRLAELAD
jgi:RNA polymerase-binding transcription factor DksA